MSFVEFTYNDDSNNDTTQHTTNKTPPQHTTRTTNNTTTLTNNTHPNLTDYPATKQKEREKGKARNTICTGAVFPLAAVINRVDGRIYRHVI